MDSSNGYVSKIVCGPSMWAASSLLNSNAFPVVVKQEAQIATNRFAMFLHHCSSLSAELGTAISNFQIHLQRNWAVYVANANRAEVELIAFADGLEYTTCLYTVLYEFKAFMDVYARFLYKVINHEDLPVNGFRSAGIEGCKLSSGKLAN